MYIKFTKHSSQLAIYHFSLKKGVFSDHWIKAANSVHASSRPESLMKEWMLCYCLAHSNTGLTPSHKKQAKKCTHWALYQVSLLNTHVGGHMAKALGFSKGYSCPFHLEQNTYLLYLGLLKTGTPSPCLLKDSGQFPSWTKVLSSQ